MERIPRFRIIGKASEEKKEIVRKEKEQALFDHPNSFSPEELTQLRKLEYPKSEKEISLIGFANKETNELMLEVGAEPYTVPIENFHIVPPEFYKKSAGEGSSAIT